MNLWMEKSLSHYPTINTHIVTENVTSVICHHKFSNLSPQSIRNTSRSGVKVGTNLTNVTTLEPVQYTVEIERERSRHFNLIIVVT